MKSLRILCLLLVMVTVSACQTTNVTPKDYTHFREVDPHSILIVPAVNRSLEVTAPDYYLSTISVPLAERGYYVFPVHLVKRVMEDDGLSDADMVHAAPTDRLAQMFGADAVLYVTIERWESQYIVLSTQTIVGIDYVLKDGATGETLWHDKRVITYSPQVQGGGLGGLIAQAIMAAVERAAPNYMPLARQVNTIAVGLKGFGLPNGPYSKKYGKDQELFPSVVKIEEKPKEESQSKAPAAK